MRRRDFLLSLTALAAMSRPCFGREGRVAHVFGELPKPENVRRIMAAGPPAGVLAAVLAPDKLIGWPWNLSSEARSLLAPVLRDLPAIGRLTGRSASMPMEKLLAAKPDLIIDAGTVDATYLSMAERVHQQTGIPYVLFDGQLADSPRQLREAGAILGVAARGEALAAAAEKILVPCGALRRPKVYLARSADGLETALPGTVHVECIEAACGVPAMPPTGRGGNLARVSPEQVLLWAPDFILTISAEFLEHARADAFWQNLPAVRAGRLLLAPGLPFGWIDGPPGVNCLIGVRWLRQRLQASGDPAQLKAEAREFHRLFYGHTPGNEDLERILRNA